MRHQRADDGRGEAEVRHQVAIDKGPEPIRSREVGRALVQHQSRAPEQRAGDRPRAHHPAEVGEPEQGVA